MDPLFKETLGKAFTLFLGVAALGASGWGGYGLVANVAWFLTTEATEGRVTVYERALKPQTWNPVIEFHPTPETKITFVSKLEISTPDPARGSMVPVRYLRRNPQEAELSLFRLQWAQPIVFMTFGLAVLFLWWRRMVVSWNADSDGTSASARKKQEKLRAKDEADAAKLPAVPAGRRGAKVAPRVEPQPEPEEPWDEAGDAAAAAPGDGSEAWERTAIKGSEPAPGDGSEAWERTAIKGNEPVPDESDAWDRTSVLPSSRPPPRRR